MTDWKLIAHARGLDVPEEAVRNIAPSLDALEQAFRPLVKRLTPDNEPAVTLSEGAVFGQ